MEGMKLEPLISIIVPMYNAEQFLTECIESILDQTYKNFELIIVDDASKDNSLKIAQSYALRDSRVKVFSSKENRGVSAVRNYGMRVMGGQYLVFIDADDYVSSNYLSQLFRTVKQFKNKLVTCSMTSVNGDRPFGNYQITDETDVHDRDTYLVNQYVFHPWVWGAIFDCGIIRRNEIVFDENTKFGEDAYFVAKYLCFVDGVAINKSKLYYYFQNPNGGAINKRDKKYLPKDVLHRATSYYAYRDTLEFYKRHSPEMEIYLNAGYCFLAADILLMAERANLKEFSEKKYLKTNLNLKNVWLYSKYSNSRKRDFFIWGMMVNPWMISFLLDDLKVIELVK